MNNLPGVADMLALLDALKKNVRDFVTREEKLESDFRVSTAGELRDFAARNGNRVATGPNAESQF